MDTQKYYIIEYASARYSGLIWQWYTDAPYATLKQARNAVRQLSLYDGYGRKAIKAYRIAGHTKTGTRFYNVDMEG